MIPHRQEIIEYIPYRGDIEPVTKVHEAKVILYPTHMETILAYDYLSSKEGVQKEDYVQYAILQIKDRITLTRCRWSHDDAPEDHIPGVQIDDGEIMILRFKTDKEADKFYTKIKNWLLA